MNEYETPTEESDGIEVEKRTRRALEEPLSVLSVDGTPLDETDTTIVSVVSHSGEQYTVDVREGRCTCPDAEYNLDADEQLGQHAFEPAVASADGGIVDAGDDGVVLDDDADAGDERPADCDCAGFHADATLPCWPCYRAGYDEPADVDE